MNNYEIGSVAAMQKKYNRSKYEMLLHGCYYHPNYRYAAVSVSGDEICDLLLKAHIASNRLSAELEGEDKTRLRLRPVLTLKIEDAVLANETRFYWEDELRSALEELYGLYEGNRIEPIIGINPSAPQRYSLTIIAEYELPIITTE